MMQPLPEKSSLILPPETGLTGTVETVMSGAINDILLFTDPEGKKKVLRQRTREKIFGYEKGFFKEPLIASFLGAAKPFDPAYNEKVFDLAARSLLVNPTGGESHAPPMPKTLSYDHSMKKLPYLWMVQDFAEGPLLIDAPSSEKEWYKLGQTIGRLHSMQLEKSGPFDNRTQTAEERIQSIVDFIQAKSPVPLARSFNVQALASGPMSLVHGDAHSRNVIAGKEMTLLDWDNAAVDFPELDLVKPMHWNAADAKGFFIPNAKNYEAYMKGHKSTFGAEPDAERMKLYELLWLTRVYRFEEMRETSGRTPAPPAPPAKTYLPRIAQLASGG